MMSNYKINPLILEKNKSLFSGVGVASVTPFDRDGNVDLGCGCGLAGPSGCDETCGSTAEFDECGECGGDNSSCSGCTDTLAFNYDEPANTNNDLCIAKVFGCTDSDAYNYDSTANTNNGLCIAKVYGCKDSLAFNYNSAANTDDGSCIPIILGCTDISFYNFNPSANTDDGTCGMGCTYPSAYNYQPDATIEDGGLIYYNRSVPTLNMYKENAQYLIDVIKEINEKKINR